MNQFNPRVPRIGMLHLADDVLLYGLPEPGIVALLGHTEEPVAQLAPQVHELWLSEFHGEVDHKADEHLEVDVEKLPGREDGAVEMAQCRHTAHASLGLRVFDFRKDERGQLAFKNRWLQLRCNQTVFWQRIINIL